MMHPVTVPPSIQSNPAKMLCNTSTVHFIFHPVIGSISLLQDYRPQQPRLLEGDAIILQRRGHRRARHQAIARWPVRTLQRNKVAHVGDCVALVEARHEARAVRQAHLGEAGMAWDAGWRWLAS